jgi:excisionase family DNA binding protein
MTIDPFERLGARPFWSFRRRDAAGRQRRTYSVGEVADLLGISRSTAYECVHRGEIPALRFGQRLVVPIDAIEDLLDSVGPAAAVADDESNQTACTLGADERARRGRSHEVATCKCVSGPPLFARNGRVGPGSRTSECASARWLAGSRRLLGR